jgi:hypothetical protein
MLSCAVSNVLVDYDNLRKEYLQQLPTYVMTVFVVFEDEQAAKKWTFKE